MKINKETIKTWTLIALIFAVLGFVGGWQAHDKVQIQVKTTQASK